MKWKCPKQIQESSPLSIHFLLLLHCRQVAICWFTSRLHQGVLTTAPNRCWPQAKFFWRFLGWKVWNLTFWAPMFLIERPKEKMFEIEKYGRGPNYHQLIASQEAFLRQNSMGSSSANHQNCQVFILTTCGCKGSFTSSITPQNLVHNSYQELPALHNHNSPS